MALIRGSWIREHGSIMVMHWDLFGENANNICMEVLIMSVSEYLQVECRVLDFSECETPGVSRQKGKSGKAMSFTSPSAYLLKGCR
ncbi:hypothetical protein MLD38_015424 [Melastoma candidum]|uniref:Uncharacterized protein n=1 Tax=Melastoma candidum TaxID=119954 RepID=A0ACB9RPI2_9MYRT|nr:hypothetical protein MLD38_015424 [Melastoma candidum]